MPHDIIALSCVPWEYLKIAPQQTVRELTRDRRVLYIERARSIGAVLLEPGKWWQDMRRWLVGPREVEPNLYVVTPPPAWPWRTRSLLSNRLTMAGAGRAARRAQQQLCITEPVYWSYLPQGHLLAGSFGEVACVYDVVDEYSAFPGMDQDLCASLESAMLAAANVVFAISPNLVTDRRDRNPLTFLCPIGAEAEAFVSASRDDAMPQSIADVPAPRIGYYGGLDSRVDHALCIAAAKAIPDASFLYFGPVHHVELPEELRVLPNVYFPGPIPYADLAAHAVHFDVCHLPYRMNRFNQYIFPNKTFEYLATGNPVVTTPIPSLSYLEDAGVLARAATPDDYIAALRGALTAGRSDAAVRQRVATENTWAARAARMDAVIEAVLDGECDPVVLAPKVEPQLASSSTDGSFS